MTTPHTTPDAERLEPVAEALRRGGLALLTDRGRPERGGVVVGAAIRASDDVINFIATWARGITAVAVPEDRAARIGLVRQATDPRVRQEVRPDADRWAVTVEAREGVTTGISASDRAATVRLIASPHVRANELTTPGHVHPVLADVRGLVARQGWPEATCDALRVSGLDPVGVYAQLLDDDGELLTGEALGAFATAHDLPTASVEAIIGHRLAHETFVQQQSQSTLPTRYGPFLARAFTNLLDDQQHLALSIGETRGAEPLLVRIHSECLTGDVFGSQRCDCGGQLDAALKRIAEAGRGAVIYLRQEGRGIGLLDKIRAYALQDAGRDTVEANLELGLPVDRRDFSLGAQILHVLGARRVRLMTNNPGKVAALERFGISVVAREPLETEPNDANRDYLATKKMKLGHLLGGV
jgi:3,4-dihydroxy 2-butanone 4-phosphate synthase/GTP cyclohydrolase II